MVCLGQTNEIDEVDQADQIDGIDGTEGIDQKGQMTPQFQDVQKTWSRIADAFRQPEAVVYMESQAFDKFLRALANNGVLPLYAKLLQEHGVFEKLSPDQKKTIAIAVLRHKAASVVLWCAFDEVMATLRKAGLHPMPIKGTHLGICYYDEPYLRPMVDIDLFFLDLSEAEKGYELFLSNGYLCCEPTRGGDRWLWSRHLPELRKPGARHHIELHGGLIFPPRDRRCQKERVLLEELEEVQYDSYTFKVLKPEAAVIFTLAHTFERHSTDPPRLIAFQDVVAILKKEGLQFDWDRLTWLASESGFVPTTAFGLAAARNYLDAPVPDDVANGLAPSFADGPSWSKTSFSYQTALSRKELAAFGQSLNLTTALKRCLVMIFPSRDFMRYRYPDKNQVALALLYPYRWWVQCQKLLALVLERIKHPRQTR